ncbi:orotidine-5'-phosphate decarboxylase [Sediminitomix flava]|uniref:Orotidine 5'-phosphate decarboxylase n=1 Tax=Sediminitomix flava TaxID=379075 RepID=A0A315ZFU4_SEDFL|nr:orotidine-5'-phosphate decarboxylase [Sediminitomix flava]PWJ44010.1 orotidine-5'-phosphate decarboxylase [Sediminitomix flava]
MNKAALFEQIQKKKSFLCVGLDTDPSKIPAHLLDTEDPIFEFNKAIIDATKDYCVAYKPNIAFYEALGVKGWESLQKTLDYIPSEIFTIADAKRGDIGNTSKMYAKAFFESMNFDSITVAPYMGEDSVTPFLEFDNKWVILLAATSNKGGLDFQYQKIENGQMVFEKVLEKSLEWGNEKNLMYVVGATRADFLEKVRKIVPNSFLLVPGVGAQGGSLEEVAKYGMNDTCGLLVNSSRGIIYASNSEDFAEVASAEAKKLQEQMAVMLEKYS